MGKFWCFEHIPAFWAHFGGLDLLSLLLLVSLRLTLEFKVAWVIVIGEGFGYVKAPLIPRS